MTTDRDIGLIGLDVMGVNLALNAADRGFGVVGYDKSDETRKKARDKAGDSDGLAVVDDVETLVGRLKTPRLALILVPAGKAVDAGNSRFSDTNRRGRPRLTRRCCSTGFAATRRCSNGPIRSRRPGAWSRPRPSPGKRRRRLSASTIKEPMTDQERENPTHYAAEGYARAVELLRECSTPLGFLASPTDRDNYRRIWARDGCIMGLAALVGEDDDLVETFPAHARNARRASGPPWRNPQQRRRRRPVEQLRPIRGACRFRTVVRHRVLPLS